MLLLSIAKWHELLNSQPPVYDGDRQAPPDLSSFQKEQIWIQIHDWLIMSQCWHSYVEKPTDQIFNPICFLKELIYIYKITQILDMNKFPPTYTTYVDSGTCETVEKPRRNFTWVGEAPTWKILSHHIEFYAMYTLSLNGRSFILRLKLNLIIHFSSHFHSLLLPL